MCEREIFVSGCVSEYFDTCDFTITNMFVCVCMCACVCVCVCVWSCKYLSQDEFIKETVCINLPLFKACFYRQLVQVVANYNHTSFKE